MVRSARLAFGFGLVLFPALGIWLLLHQPMTWRLAILFGTSSAANMLYFWLAGTNERLLRRWTFLSVSLWGLNNLATPSAGGLVLNAVEIISMGVGLARSQRKMAAAVTPGA